MHTLMSEQDKEAEHYLFYSTSFVSVIIIESWNLVQKNMATHILWWLIKIQQWFDRQKLPLNTKVSEW